MIVIETDYDIRSRKKKLILRTEGGRYIHVIEDADAAGTWEAIRRFSEEYAGFDKRKEFGTHTTDFN